jgi:hypothetical protein
VVIAAWDLNGEQHEEGIVDMTAKLQTVGVQM